MIEVPKKFDAQLALEALVYDTTDLAASVKAFHRHYRGSETEVLVSEDSRILFNILEQQRRVCN